MEKKTKINFIFPEATETKNNSTEKSDLDFSIDIITSLPIKKEDEKEKTANVLKNLKTEPPKVNVSWLYTKRINNYSITKLGTQAFEYFFKKQKKTTLIPEDFLLSHSIIPRIRSQMVNWMLEITYVLNCSDKFFFAAAKIMDTYFFQTKKSLKNEDVQLIGMVSMFIASKIYELNPIPLEVLIHKIGYDKYSAKQILEMERNMVKEVRCDIWNEGNAYECASFLIIDSYVNNYKYIKKYDLKKEFQKFEYFVNYILKMCKYSESFSSKNEIDLCMASLVFSYDLFKSVYKNATKECKCFLKKWLSFLFEGIYKEKGKKKGIEKLYNEINEYYKYIKTIENNLNNFHPLMPFE